MDNTDTALSGHCDRHSMFCNGIHSRTHQRNVQLDLFCQPGSHVDLIGNYLRVCRHQQHIVKGNAFANNLTHLLSSCVF